jgi:hypothetical protein
VSDPVRLDAGSVAAAAARLAQARDTPSLVAALLELVRAWAAPSAAFAAVRDEHADGGWRLLPAVVLGSVPVGIARTLGRVGEEAPDALGRGGIVQRGEEIAGVRARDNWAVPFWTGEQSGALFLRGVPRPAPEGLAEALALASAAVWPRVLGSPADRVEALVAEVRAAADRLASEAQRQLEALEARRPVAAAEESSPVETTETAAETQPAASEARAIDEGRLAALESELRTLEGELQRLTAEARDARADAEMLRGERDALRNRLAAAEEASAERALLAERLAAAEARAAEHTQLAERLAAAEARVAEHAQLADRLAQAEAAAAERGSLAERLSEVETRAQEVSSLTERLEVARRTAEAADVRARKAEEELATAQRELALTRARAGQQDEERRQRLAEAEAKAHATGEQWESARRALRAATAAVRRAAFLPPAVRVSVQEAVAPEESDGRGAPWMGALLLDRDAVSLETVADGLEAAGLDVRIASHPEEVALLLRTADAAALGAVVCDVMAFRPDQNVAGLIRAWDKDRPGLAYFLSFDTESAAEVERARRIPTSIIAGHVPRPLAPPRIVETLETLAKRRGRL